MKEFIRQKANYRMINAKCKDNVICYAGSGVVLCR